jgi:hypothetical protein
MFLTVHSWSPLQMSFGRQYLHFPQVIFLSSFQSSIDGLYLSLHSYYNTFSRKSQGFSEKILPKQNFKSQTAAAANEAAAAVFLMR